MRYAILVLVAVSVVAVGCGGDGGPTASNPFAGNYTGTYSGSESGTINVTVSTVGRLTGQAVSPSCGTMVVSGSVSAAGDVSASARCGQWTISYAGLFVAGPPRTGSGTWRSSSGYSGTWQVRETP